MDYSSLFITGFWLLNTVEACIMQVPRSYVPFNKLNEIACHAYYCFYFIPVPKKSNPMQVRKR